MGVYRRPDSPVWWLYLETTRQREPTTIRVGETATQRRDSRRLAEELYHQRMQELSARLYRLPSATRAIRFSRYAQDYLRDTIPLRRGADRERDALVHLERFFGDDLLTAIDQDRVRAYMNHRMAPLAPGVKAVSARTVNREVDLLKAMLRDAVPKYLPSSPIAGMKRLAVTPPRRRIMTVDEERRLLEVGDLVDRALLILGLDTLVRLSDLLDLRRADRQGPWIYIAQTKTGDALEVPLSPRAQAALDALEAVQVDADDNGGQYYFAKFRRAENPRDWRGSVRQRLELLCRKAGISYGRKAGGITWHWATRRTGATRYVVGQRVPIPVVQQLGGWKSPDVLLEIYTEAQREDLLKAVGAFTPRSRKRRKVAGNP